MIAEAMDILSGPHEYKYGVDARFIQLNKKWGFKFFRSEDMCNWTYEMQSLAWEFNMAPRVGQKHSFQHKWHHHENFEPAYGYVTEICEPLGYNAKQKWYTEQLWLFYNLKEFFSTINVFFCDMHEMNCGFLNGKLVCFDFSGCGKMVNYDK